MSVSSGYSLHRVGSHGEESDDEMETTRSSRASRNSTGAKEEFLGPRDDDVTEASSKNDGRMLLIVFLSMVFVGLGNKVFNKLMTIPMYV